MATLFSAFWASSPSVQAACSRAAALPPRNRATRGSMAPALTMATRAADAHQRHERLNSTGTNDGDLNGFGVGETAQQPPALAPPRCRCASAPREARWHPHLRWPPGSLRWCGRGYPASKPPFLAPQRCRCAPAPRGDR
eukprot:scaffold15884_cov74-Phaeocystis_antarctica.AAC.3